MASKAFQISAFQENAFQSAVLAVAPSYSLGSPTFATPALTEVLHANAYSLGSPAFGSPILSTAQLIVHANAYSLGSPTFGSGYLGGLQYIASVSYSLGSPDFAAPGAVEHLTFAATAYSLGSPTFGSPNYFVAPAYSLGSPVFAYGPPIRIVGHSVHANDYSLGSPSFNYPLAGYTITLVPWPPFYATMLDEVHALLSSILEQLMGTFPTRSSGAYAVRRAVGYVLANVPQLLPAGEISAPLLACWDAAVAAGATFDAMDRLRVFIDDLVPDNNMNLMIVETCLIYTIVEQSRLAASTTFVSTDDVQNMIGRLGSAFEDVAVNWWDRMPAAPFESIAALSSAVMQHLNITELQVPRINIYTTAQPMPLLVTAYSLYEDVSRWEEIIAENGVIHPAFPPLTLNVLSQ